MLFLAQAPCAGAGSSAGFCVGADGRVPHWHLGGTLCQVSHCPSSLPQTPPQPARLLVSPVAAPRPCAHSPRAKSPILPPRCHLDADPGRAGRAGVLGSSSVPRSLSPRLHPAPSSDMHVLTWPHCAGEKPQSWGAWLCVPTALGGARAPPSEPVPSPDLGTPHSGLPGGSRASS